MKQRGCSNTLRGTPNAQMQDARDMRNEEAHPAFARYTPQMHARRMPGAFLNSPSIQEMKFESNEGIQKSAWKQISCVENSSE